MNFQHNQQVIFGFTTDDRIVTLSFKSCSRRSTPKDSINKTKKELDIINMKLIILSIFNDNDDVNNVI
jgi:hypothetical protein